MSDADKRIFVAAPRSELRSPRFVHKLARFIADLELSGHHTMEWLVDEVYSVPTGNIRDNRGKILEFTDADVEGLFGEDARRAINSFKRFAGAQPRRAVNCACVSRIMWLDLARQIYLYRQSTEH